MKKSVLRRLLEKRKYEKHIIDFKVLDKVEDAKATVIEVKPKKKAKKGEK
jgi:hypothetical protein